MFNHTIICAYFIVVQLYVLWYNFIKNKGGGILARAKRADGKNARTVASNKYQKENYERINILAPLDYKEKVKPYAERANVSLSAYIIEAINEKMEREKPE